MKMESNFKKGDTISRIFEWKVWTEDPTLEIDKYYFQVELKETEHVFRAWGNEARMELTNDKGSRPFIHYYSPKRYAAAVVEFVELCQEHFGNDWLDRGG